MQSFEVSVGIVFVLGVSSLGAYSLLMAGYGSSNKFALLGALRASAQMVSYELALGLSLVGALLIYGSFSFRDIIAQQMGPLSFTAFGEPIPSRSSPIGGFSFSPSASFYSSPPLSPKATACPSTSPRRKASWSPGFIRSTAGLKC